MKLPIPSELLGQLDETRLMMGKIVSGLEQVVVKLDELIAIERKRK